MVGGFRGEGVVIVHDANIMMSVLVIRKRQCSKRSMRTLGSISIVVCAIAPPELRVHTSFAGVVDVGRDHAALQKAQEWGAITASPRIKRRLRRTLSPAHRRNRRRAPR